VKVSTERIPEARVVMTIEVEPERLEEARTKALRRLAPRAKVPGFRPGKAPPDMVRRHIGEERILDEALDVLVPDVYREAVEADDTIDPVARPQLQVETTEPLVVKATISVRPTIELGDYRSVRIETQPIELDESRIQDTLLALRRRAATLEPIERELRWRDVVTMDIQGAVDGESLIKEEDATVQLVEERDILFPGFEEELLGHKKGETVEFDLPVPEQTPRPELAGKPCHFTVSLKETKEEILPELDDEFAKSVAERFETVEALRDGIRDDIRQREEQQRLDGWHEQILDQLVEKATVEFPAVMLDAEVDRLLHDRVGQVSHGKDMERVLASVGRTEEQMHQELRPVADARLRRSLILGEVAEAESIDVSDEDIDQEIATMTVAAGEQGEQLRQLFSREEGRATIRRNLITRRTLERLVEIATEGATAAGTAPATEKKPAAKKARRAKKEAVETTAGAGAPADEEKTGDQA
jgi:trigger factor